MADSPQHVLSHLRIVMELGNGVADELGAFVTARPQLRLIHPQDPPIRIEPVQTLGGVLEEIREFLPAALELELSPREAPGEEGAQPQETEQQPRERDSPARHGRMPAIRILSVSVNDVRAANSRRSSAHASAGIGRLK